MIILKYNFLVQAKLGMIFSPYR